MSSNPTTKILCKIFQKPQTKKEGRLQNEDASSIARATYIEDCDNDMNDNAPYYFLTNIYESSLPITQKVQRTNASQAVSVLVLAPAKFEGSCQEGRTG